MKSPTKAQDSIKARRGTIKIAHAGGLSTSRRFISSKDQLARGEADEWIEDALYAS
jgi:hypothetical protein